MELFASTISTAGYFGIVTTGMAMWAAVYYLPMYYEGVLGYSFVMGAVALLPLTLTVSPAAVVTGGLITQMGKYRTLLWIGWVIPVIGTGLITYLKEGMSPPQWIFITLIPGLGIGMLLSTMQIAVQAAAKEEHAAQAAAMVPELRTYGQTIGLAIFSASFSNVVKNHLEQSVILRDRAAELMMYSLWCIPSRASPMARRRRRLSRPFGRGLAVCRSSSLQFLQLSPS